MVIGEILRAGEESLGKVEYANGSLEARLILEELLGVDRLYLMLNPREVLDQNLVDRFFALIERRLEGYPLQYLLGKTEFMGLDFQVGEGVLIPRQDTEILVEYLLDYMDSKEYKLLEIGIGSGAIILSLAYYNRNIKALGLDISDSALKMAEKNKEALDLPEVQLIKSDLFEKLESRDFDIIVSNPPYIPPREIDRLQVELFYEPRLALDGGEDGLDFYRSIVAKAPDYLKPGGLLIFEIGFDQGQKVFDLMEEAGFKKLEILKDLQNMDRVVLGFKEG